MKQISSAFVKAQKSFGPALKDKTNPHFRSKYADLGACIDAVIDALNDNGIGLIQRTHQDDTGVTVETLFVHESGESMSGGTLHVPAPKQDPQGYGSALSYARRYSLMAACGIAPEDDDGNAASRKPESRPEQRQQTARDDSPKARAERITAGVGKGDAENAALAMSAWDQPLRDSVWNLIDDATQQKLLAVWPKG